MNNEETEFDEGANGKKTRRTRKRNEERDIFVYRILDGEAKKQGSFPESVIGNPLERRLPMFLKEMFGTGEYRTDVRKPNGHYERSFEFSIAAEPDRSDNNNRAKIIEVESEEVDDDIEELNFAENNGQMNAVEVENLLLKERLKRIEDDFSRQRTGNRSEMQTLISALEESRREQRELMMMMLSQSQKPQQDATTQAMNILEKSLGIVTKAKAISEEIAPQETSSNGGILSDAAVFMDSLGRNAGQFLPMFLGNRANNPPAQKPSAKKSSNTPPANKTEPGELTDLLNKVKNKKEGKSK